MSPPDRPRQLLDALQNLETARDDARAALIAQIIDELGASSAEAWVCIQSLSEGAGLDDGDELFTVCRLLEGILAARADRPGASACMTLAQAASRDGAAAEPIDEERLEACIRALGEILLEEFPDAGHAVLVAAWDGSWEEEDTEEANPPSAPLDS